MSTTISALFRPTWRLMLFALVSLSVLAAAMNYQKNNLHWLSYACLGFMTIGVAYSWFITWTMHWQWSGPSFAFAHEGFTVNAENITMQGTFGEGDVLSKQNQCGAHTIGLLELKTSTWSTEYPLGLFRSVYTIPKINPIWIYPAKINHFGIEKHTIPDSEWTNIRGYQQGDRPKLLVKKTQTLPMTHWQVRTIASDLSSSPMHKASHLSWSDFPEHWTPLQKLEQLSYDVYQLGDNDVFFCTLKNGCLEEGKGMPHKHLAWKLLAQEWKHWS